MSEGNQELVNQGGGVEPDPAAQPGAGQPGPTAPQPASPTAGEPSVGQLPVGKAEPVIDLDSLPGFREYKASTNRRFEEQRQQTLQAQQQVQLLQDELAQTRLADATPEEREKYYRGLAEKARQQMRQQQESARQAAELQQKADAFLKKLGLDWNTPGLDLDGGATPEGYTRLVESAAEIAAARKETQAASAQDAAQDAARQARQDALRQAGVTRQDLGGTALPGAKNPIADINDASTLIRMGFQSPRRRPEATPPQE